MYKDLVQALGVRSPAVEGIRSAPRDMPFVLAAGLFLQHVPCLGAQRWFDLYADDGSVLREFRADDRNETTRSRGVCIGIYANPD